MMQLLLKQNPKKYPQRVQWKYVAHYSRYGQRLRETDALKGDFHTKAKIPRHQEHLNLGFVKRRRRPPHMGQFLQGGKNGRLMSFFLNVEPPCDQT